MVPCEQASRGQAGAERHREETAVAAGSSRGDGNALKLVVGMAAPPYGSMRNL